MKDKETKDLEPVLLPDPAIARLYTEEGEDFSCRIDLIIRSIISGVVKLALAQVGREEFGETIIDARDLRLFIASCSNKIRGFVYIAIGEGQTFLNPSLIDQWEALGGVEEDLLDEDGYYRFFLKKDSSEYFDRLVFVITEEVRTYALLSSDCYNLSDAFGHNEEELEVVAEDFSEVVKKLNNSIRFALSNVVAAVGIKCVEVDDELYERINDFLMPIAVGCNAQNFNRFVFFAFAALRNNGFLPSDASLDRNEKWKESFIDVLRELYDLYNGSFDFDSEEDFEKGVRTGLNNMLFCLKVYKEGFVDSDKKTKRGKRRGNFRDGSSDAKQSSGVDSGSVAYLKPLPTMYSKPGTDEES